VDVVKLFLFVLLRQMVASPAELRTFVKVEVTNYTMKFFLNCVQFFFRACNIHGYQWLLKEAYFKKGICSILGLLLLCCSTSV